MRSALVFATLSVSLAASAGAAHAGGCTAGCTTCCAAPTSYSVKVPGVTVIPPTIYIQPAKITGGVGGDYNGGFGSTIEASLSASSSASASASTSGAAQSSGLAVANSQAANLLAASGGGGGGSSFFSDGGSSGNIPNLIVAAPAEGPVATRQVCVRSAAVARAVAVQAVCLDDQSVPHPASQTAPGRDVAESFSGELFRCIAGAHLQFVTADFAGEARFDHGQTVVCQKGDALWRGLDGRLQCRPQAPARDCNERSLLRRYGAGIKVVRAAAAQCVEWRTETVQAATPVQGQSFAIDGGVG